MFFPGRSGPSSNHTQTAPPPVAFIKYEPVRPPKAVCPLFAKSTDFFSVKAVLVALRVYFLDNTAPWDSHKPEAPRAGSRVGPRPPAEAPVAK